MKNSTVLLWWFLYMLVGTLAAMAGGFVFGFVAGLLSLPELPMLVILFPVLFYINFAVYRWSVNKIIES
tara:strand:+ start:16739 stop:16945 length:207 start_codon:yes stop_codon:yes gene_type:complete